MNSFDDLLPEYLGEAGVVYEHVLVSQLQWSEGWRVGRSGGPVRLSE